MSETFDPLKAECRVAGCDEVISSGAIVCSEHDDRRCPRIVTRDANNNHVVARRCRAYVKAGKLCWRHKDG